MAAYRCDLCGGPFIKVAEKKIGDMTYLILKCESCHHQIARQK